MNLASYFLDHNLPERAHKVAVRYTPPGGLEQSYTFHQMHVWSNRVGNRLRSMQLREEDRVLFALDDTPEFAAHWFGALRVGGVVAMMNPGVTSDDWAYYLEYTRAAVLVTARSYADQHAARIAHALRHGQLRGTVIVDDPLHCAITEAMPEACTTADSALDDPGVWLFSSGSTGKPKACMHVNGDFIFNTERYAKAVLGIREDDVTLGVPKLFFGYATGTNLMFPWAVGATTCLYSERSTPEIVLAHIARYKPTILTNVPTMIHRMLEHPACDTTDLSSLRMVLSAGEALPAELYRRWTERTGVEILDGIGSAELFHIYLTNAPGDVKLGTLGRPVPGYTLKLVDDQGTEVAQGEIGTLIVGTDDPWAGTSNAWGYHRDRAKSRDTFRGAWTHTGDQFRVDEDGRYVYCGRADDLLKVGGVYVSPVEVENCLLTHPSVREAAVIGVERDGLVTTVACIVPTERTEGLDRAIQDFVKSRLAPHKYPRFVRFYEVLPRNDRGKVARGELRRALLGTL
jgi:benzoate-CoA ligase family protein